MPNEHPVIKFSPFEALLIGEKNRIIKRQPMKNTIFVTNLNKERKSIDLRDLFDLKKDLCMSKGIRNTLKKCKKVKNLIKNRKLRSKDSTDKFNLKNHKNLFCYEFEGRKMVVKGNEFLEFKPEDKKLITKKVKFKNDFKLKETPEEKVVKKIQNRDRTRYPKKENQPPEAKNCRKIKLEQKRHSMRGPNGRFIPKSVCEHLNRERVSVRKSYLSRYIRHLYLKKNKKLFNNNVRFKCGRNNRYRNAYNFKKIVELTTRTDKLSTPLHGSAQYYEFPPFPKRIQPKDFEDDSYFNEILYENHPFLFKFRANDNLKDFSDALKQANIILPVKRFKSYERKITGAKHNRENEDINVIFNNSLENDGCLIPYFDLDSGEDLNVVVTPMKRRNGFNQIIDKPPTKESHLIAEANIGNFLFRNSSGNEILFGNYVKPILHDCPFGAIPDV